LLNFGAFEFGANFEEETAAESLTSKQARLLRFCTGFAVLGLGLLQAWTSRHSMQSDGISYLDMGDAIVRGDWRTALNGFWSPMYPSLLGLALHLVRPPACWQFTVVHLVNFAIFVFEFGCFDFFLEVVLRCDVFYGGAKRGQRAIPEWAFFPLGYAIFAWCSLKMIGMERVSPDTLMAGFVFVAVGQLVRILSGSARLSSFALLGAILGVGYLAKAPILPLSLIIMALAAFGAGGARHVVIGLLAAVLPFAFLAGPWIAAISIHAGRLIVSDSERVAYIHYVNGAAPGWYFQSLGTARGSYLHTVRKIHNRPDVYEFAAPLKGTQPIWYDPSYWTEGASPRILFGPWFKLVRSQLRAYASIVLHGQWILIIGFLAFLAANGRPRWRDFRAEWPTWIPGLAGLTMYAFILVDERYVAVFFTLVWIALFAMARTARVTLPSRGGLMAALLSLALFVLLSVSITRHFLASRHLQDTHWQVASELHSLGVGEGDRVARIGGLYAASWARLLGATVVAEIPLDQAATFWSASEADQAEVIASFRLLNVKAVVAERVVAADMLRTDGEWHSAGDGRFTVLVLR
jgi:hypothetical protein